MQLKIPKNTDKYQWTEHSIYKMKQYGLTAQRVLRVINNPQRKEVGIVKNTIAVMQPTSMNTKNGKRVWSSEVWCMYVIKKHKIQETNHKQIQNSKIQNPHSAFGHLLPAREKGIKIISAWRYPGVSPERDPIPEEILREVEEMA